MFSGIATTRVLFEELINTQRAGFPIYSYPVVDELARSIDKHCGEHVCVHVNINIFLILILGVSTNNGNLRAVTIWIILFLF